MIAVEHLSKKYIIGHNRDLPYETMRELMTSAGRTFFKKLRHPLGGFDQGDPQYETFWALRGVDFTIGEGERVGIIGPNGAGKSTLLKILSRITPPTEGRARIVGRISSLLEVGTGFHPELTGRENIFLNGAILGMSRADIKKRFDEMVAFAEIEKFLDTPVKRYSSGMYVRLAFSVAAHLESEILVVDEVLAVGDHNFQQRCLGKMGNVAQSGRTVLFVSHNMSAIKSMCNRAILLKEGKILADGPPDEVVSQYLQSVRVDTLIREWDDEALAPNTESVVIKKIQVVTVDGQPLEELYTDTAFHIQIAYRVKQQNAHVGFTVVVYDGENNCVLGSISNREANWYGKPMPSGDYVSQCGFPAHFFNHGQFNINLLFFEKGFTNAETLNSVLSLNILDSPQLRGDYYGGFSGVVRPDLKWETYRA